MQADDWIPNNWNGVPAGVAIEGGLLSSDVNGFSDASLEPTVVPIEDTGLIKVQVMATSFEVNVFGHLRFLHHTLPFVLRETSPEVSVSLAYVKVLAFSVITSTARYMVNRSSDITLERFVLRSYKQTP